MAIYLEDRPTDFDQIVGQDVQIVKLKNMLKKGTLPNVILFTGPTGCGKTSAARILSSKLGVPPVEGEMNFTEMNCANCRGIDDVREIASEMRLGPMGGKARVYILDEVVQLPRQTQQATLKMLEDTPKHVYFFLCTTDKSSLLDTLVGRCHPVSFKALSRFDLGRVMDRSLKERNYKLADVVLDRIFENVNGSARMALQLLESVLAHEDLQKQLDSIEEESSKAAGIDLVRAIVNRKPWTEVAGIIKNLSCDAEVVRRIALTYCETILLGNSPMPMKSYAAMVIREFAKPWFDAGRPALSAACWVLLSKVK